MLERVLDKRNTVIFVGLLTLWHLYLTVGLQLHPDEAYYWLWSRRLDVSYYDHPPMVAYFIWLTTLLSNAELWVRLTGTLMTLIASGLIWRLAIQLFKSVPVAAGSVMLFNAYPVTRLGLVVMTPDIPLFLFCAISVYLFCQIMLRQKVWLWYALAVSFGLALLSKYTAVLLLPCFFIYLVLTEHRRWLKTIHPYMALCLGLLFFLPVVYWNSQHDWISLQHQFNNGLGESAHSFGNVATYLGGQMLLTGPFVWLLGLIAVFAGIWRWNKETLLLICVIVPVVGFFAVSSFWKLAGPNWPVFAYLTSSILVSSYCLAASSRVRRSLWTFAFLSSLALSAAVTLHAKFRLIPFEKFSAELAEADATNWFYGWRELGVELKKYPEKAFALTPSHQLSAEIIYYTQSDLPALTDSSARPSEFNLWRWPSDIHGKDGLYVWAEGSTPGPYAEYFSSTHEPESLVAYRDGKAVRTYHVVSGHQNLIAPAEPGPCCLRTASNRHREGAYDR